MEGPDIRSIEEIIQVKGGTGTSAGHTATLSSPAQHERGHSNIDLTLMHDLDLKGHKGYTV